MKKVRRIMVLALFAALLLSCSVSASAAAADTYFIGDLDLSIALPSECYVFTRDMEADDPLLSSMGVSRDALLEYMEASECYLDAIEKNGGYAISVTMYESPLTDFNQMDDSALNALFPAMKDELASEGAVIKKFSIYPQAQTKFLKISSTWELDEGIVYCLQYFTVLENRAIGVVMQSNTGPITTAREAVLKEVVDSVSFGTLPGAAPAQAGTAAFEYKDPESGLRFTVPENWQEKPLKEEREFIDAKFVSAVDPGVEILYGCADFWGELSAAERAGHTRADIDNSALTKEDIAEMLGIQAKDVIIKIYGGAEYFVAESTYTSASPGAGASAAMTAAFRVENGYIFTFQFSGGSRNERYKDFESLLSSVQYPGTKAATSAQSVSGGNFLVNLLITVLIYSAPIFIYRYGVKKEPVDSRKARRITILYAVFALLIMFGLLLSGDGSYGAGGAILLWSWVNYKVLTGGKGKKTESAEAAESAGPEAADPQSAQTEEEPAPIDEPMEEPDAQRADIPDTPDIPAVRFQKDGLPPILRRAFILAEDGEWEKADGYFERVLEEEPENAYAYLGQLLVKNRISGVEQLKEVPDLENDKLYIRALGFADDELKAALLSLKKEGEAK